jgi:hypothetical protein
VTGPATGGTVNPRYEAIARQVREEGEPYAGGTLLRGTLARGTLVCSEEGEIPVDPGDWHWLCGQAMRHAERNPGHSVAVASYAAALYAHVTDQKES